MYRVGAQFKTKCMIAAQVSKRFIMSGVSSAPAKFTNAPCFSMHGKNIRVLESPTEFYDSLIRNIRNAETRIVLASLYLGNGPKEDVIVDEIRIAMDRCPGIKVRVLVDQTRGTRGKKSSATMLTQLLSPGDARTVQAGQDHGSKDNVTVKLFHTPKLTPLMRRVLKPPLNEVIGLTHIKVYLCDDAIIVSGANLSQDYFDKRHDRYIEIADAGVCDFFEDLVETVGSMSSTLTRSGAIEPHPCHAHARQFVSEAHSKVEALLDRHGDSSLDQSQYSGREDCVSSDDNPTDTLVYPLLQMGAWGITHDQTATIELIRTMDPGSHAWLATGYFNLIPAYSRAILDSKAAFSILTASPQANGFLGARGIMGHIPAVYTKLAHEFFAQVEASACADRVALFEYTRRQWTFHVKGLWAYPPPPVATTDVGATDGALGGEASTVMQEMRRKLGGGGPLEAQLPWMTLIGSPNFGYRSVHRDIECQVAIVTTNQHLRESLHREKESVYEHSTKVVHETFRAADRVVKVWEAVATRFIRSFF
eukprot:m.1082685 g.1082685  ORF g.1082685 m.1082685 type:complete len:535 (-) comp24267_c0_seq14:2184-3788(-)